MHITNEVVIIGGVQYNCAITSLDFYQGRTCDKKIKDTYPPPLGNGFKEYREYGPGIHQHLKTLRYKTAVRNDYAVGFLYTFNKVCCVKIELSLVNPNEEGSYELFQYMVERPQYQY